MRSVSYVAKNKKIALPINLKESTKQRRVATTGDGEYPLLKSWAVLPGANLPDNIPSRWEIESLPALSLLNPPESNLCS